MKNILVPIDFSGHSYKALYFAAEIAKAAGAGLLLLFVNDVVDSPFRKKTVLELKHKMSFDDAVQLELTIIKKNIEETMHVPTRIRISAGHTQDAIIDTINDDHSDLIVMGTLGEAAFKEKLLGSITAAVIGKSSVPVLAIPLLSEWNVPKHILLVVNKFEEDSENIADPAFELAELFGARVTVAVFNDEDNGFSLEFMQNKRNILAFEQKLQSTHEATAVKPDTLHGHKFQETLDEYIDEHYVDILVMLTHKRNFAESIFNRSMTKKMSYHTDIPLLAIPVH